MHAANEKHFPGLATGSGIARALADGCETEPVLSIAEWAEDRRMIAAESGSPKPGKWRNATTPFGVEIMACLDVEHPARTVTLRCASQLIKSEIILNWFGQTIDVDPAPCMLVLPSLSEITTWNKTKWEPLLSANPRLARKVRDSVARSSDGSTSNYKAFRGGFLFVASAASSSQLQARSVKRVACDETEEFIEDNGRGDPIDQAVTRGDAHADLKALLCSTAGELPNCRITKRYDAGDRRQLYVGCLHCGARQTIAFERLVRVSPGRAAFACAACGGLHEEHEKEALLASSVWLKCYPSDDSANPAPPAVIEAEDFEAVRARRGHASPAEGRDPSFWLTQAYSPFKLWGRLLDEADAAQSGTLQAQKTFRQQKLALPYDPAVEAPDHSKLYDARGQHVTRGIVPAWACLITGAADIQNNRIEWAAYAWGPNRSGARIDWDVIDGDTLLDAPWIKLADVLARRFPGEATIDLGFDVFGIDTGGGEGRTAKAYEFVRRAVGRGDAGGAVRALKGSSDHRARPLEQGKKHSARTRSGKKRSVVLWHVGGHELKKIVYGMLFRALVDNEDAHAPVESALYFTADAPEEHFRQLTAEVYRAPSSHRAGAVGHWDRLPGRANEQLDLAVYNLALADDKGLERFGPAEWANLLAARRKADSDLPLLDMAIREARMKPNSANAGGPSAGQRPSQKPPAAAPLLPARPAPAVARNPGADRGGWRAKLARLNQATPA